MIPHIFNPPQEQPQLHPLTQLQEIKRDFDIFSQGFHGRFGFCVRDLKTGETISTHGDDIFPTASTIKTGVMVAAIHDVDTGKLKWTDKHSLPPVSGRESSMWSYYLKDDVKVNMDGFVNLMIDFSDNTALIVLRDWVGTLNVNSYLASLGLKNTRVLGGTTGNQETSDLWKKWGMGMTTPNEMNMMFDLIISNRADSPAGCDRMMRILGRQYWDDWTGATVPPTIKWLGKSGAVDRSRSECAVVYGKHPYIITMYTAEQADQRWTADNEGERLLERCAADAWHIFEPEMPYHEPKGSDQFGPTGGGVEDN